MKGKEAAQAARRRAEELEVALQSARQSAAEAKVAADERERALRAEIARLSGAIERDVARLADERVATAIDQITAEWHAERDVREERLQEACVMLATSNGFRIEPTALAKFCELVGVRPGVMYGSAENANRHNRRATASKLRFVDMASKVPAVATVDPAWGARTADRNKEGQRSVDTGEGECQ